MPVYGVDRKLVPYNMFHKVLKAGTTAIVSFTLSHYSIREDRRISRAKSDTFTANVVKVVILNLHETTIPRSPSTPSKKMKFSSQKPNSHATLKLFADTFSPVRTTSQETSNAEDSGGKGKQRDHGNPAETSTAESSSTSVQAISPQIEGAAHTDLASVFGAFINGIQSASQAGQSIDEALLRSLVPVITDLYKGVSPPSGAPSQASLTCGAPGSVADDGANPLATENPESSDADKGDAVSSPRVLPGEYSSNHWSLCLIYLLIFRLDLQRRTAKFQATRPRSYQSSRTASPPRPEIQRRPVSSMFTHRLVAMILMSLLTHFYYMHSRYEQDREKG